ncbi:MAG: hypothetical protein HY719_14830 [Planctomycetes bacterium]|nr:hypothetical protein [Planctomycetota bacterium]
MDYFAPDSRMRVVARWVAVLNFVAAMVAAFALLWNASDPFLTANEQARFFAFAPRVLPALGPALPWALAALVVINGLSIGHAVWRRHRERTDRMLRYDKEGGTVSLSVQAIEETITRSVTDLPEVAAARVRIHTVSDRGPIAIHVDYWAWEKKNLVNAESRLREAIKFRFSELVGPEAQLKASFFVRLRGIRRQPPRPAAGASSPRRAESAAPKTVERAFVGRPQYSPDDYT